MSDPKPRYLVKCGDEWHRATKATTLGMKPGWLHYEFRDGTIGLARPGTWKLATTKAKKA